MGFNSEPLITSTQGNNMGETQLQSITTDLRLALDTIEEYNEKGTKAASARVRKILGEVKKKVTGVRAELVAADKA